MGVRVEVGVRRGRGGEGLALVLLWLFQCCFGLHQVAYSGFVVARVVIVVVRVVFVVGVGSESELDVGLKLE